MGKIYGCSQSIYLADVVRYYENKDSGKLKTYG